MITYFVLSHLLKVILRKLSDFQRESTKERNKNETCDHTYLARLARATIHKKELFTKMANVGRMLAAPLSRPCRRPARGRVGAAAAAGQHS